MYKSKSRPPLSRGLRPTLLQNGVPGMVSEIALQNKMSLIVTCTVTLCKQFLFFDGYLNVLLEMV